MRETSLYCRPTVVFAVWFAMRTRGDVLVYGTDKAGKQLGPYEMQFLDTDQQLGITSGGLAVLLPLDAAMHKDGGYTLELAELLRTSRHIRKPTNYVDPDDSPELRQLLSIQGQK